MSSLVSLRRLCLASLAIAGLVLGACGSSDSSSSSSSTTKQKPAAAAPSGGGSAVKFTAEDSSGFKFDKKAATAKAGTVTLTMDNPSGNSSPHGIAVEGNGVDKDGPTVQPGAGPSKVSVKLKPGKYEFYCPVDGHRKAGMEGTLTVN
jgi:plastocyanin